MLKIKDLTAAKELNSKAMSRVVGGLNPFAILVNASTRMDNKVVDMDQVFALNLDQVNAGNVTNNQAIVGGNGRTEADVNQDLRQANAIGISGLGNAYIS